MAAQDYARQFARAERDDNAAPLAHAMLHRLGKLVSEGTIERNGQADIAEMGFGHGENSVFQYLSISVSQFVSTHLTDSSVRRAHSMRGAPIEPGRWHGRTVQRY